MPDDWHLLSISAHHIARDGFSEIKLRIWDVGFRKHRSQLPCIVTPLLLGSSKSKL